MQYVQMLFYLIIAAFFGSSIFYSVRYRRQQQRELRGVYMAKMNVSLGFLLVFIAIIQFFMFPASSLRILIGLLFFLLGLFNLFSGLRNHAYFMREMPKGEK